MSYAVKGKRQQLMYVFVTSTLLCSVFTHTSWSQQAEQKTINTPPAFCIAEQVVYEDNLFHLNPEADITQRLGADATRDDWIYRTTLCANGDWYLGQQQFVLNATADDNRYQNNKTLDYISGNGKLLWNWRTAGDWYGKIGGNYIHTLGSFINDRPLVKDEVDSYQYFGELNHDMGSFLSVTLGGKQSDTKHDAEERKVDDFRSIVGYAGLTTTSRAGNYIGVNLQRTRASYPFESLISGTVFDRDYEENISSVRFLYGLTSKTQLRGSAGYLKRDYINATDTNYSGDTWRIALQSQLTSVTQIELVGWNELNAYFDSESDHFVSRGASVTPSWMPRDNFKIAAMLWWERQQYLSNGLTVVQIEPREDKVQAGAIDLIYSPVRWFDVNLNYRYEQHDSSRYLYGFVDRVASIRLRAKI